MLITLIAAAIVVFGIVLIVRDKYHDSCAGFCCVIIGAMVLTIMLAVIAGVQIPAENDYQNALYEKEVLEYRLEKEKNNVVGNELLYNDIVEFNNGLRNEKIWSANPWTNWFNNKKIATIDYIEIPGLN